MKKIFLSLNILILFTYSCKHQSSLSKNFSISEISYPVVSDYEKKGYAPSSELDALYFRVKAEKLSLSNSEVRLKGVTLESFDVSTVKVNFIPDIDIFLMHENEKKELEVVKELGRSNKDGTFDVVFTFKEGDVLLFGSANRKPIAYDLSKLKKLITK